jgi:hypothetical protein
MEAMESRASKESVYDRLAIAVMVPAGAVIFGLAIIYSLSRVYLEVGGAGATAMATAVAVGILLVAWLFASAPKMPSWQYASVGTAVAALLVGGTVYAQVHEGPEIHRDAHVVSPEPDGTETPGGPDGPALIVMKDNVFVFNGQENPTIPAPAGQEVIFPLSNEGTALHNMQVSDASGNFPALTCRAGNETPCSDPPRILGGGEGTITINLPAGSYEYRCDFHPTEMLGTLEVS